MGWTKVFDDFAASCGITHEYPGWSVMIATSAKGDITVVNGGMCLYEGTDAALARRIAKRAVEKSQANKDKYGSVWGPLPVERKDTL